MHNFMWNWSAIKIFLIDSQLTPTAESANLNIDVCKFESLQKDESRAQSADSLKLMKNLEFLTNNAKCFCYSRGAQPVDRDLPVDL